MSDVLADTHSIVWFLFDTARLSPAADELLTVASESGKLYISAISLIEVNYLSSKKSFPYSDVFPRLIPWRPTRMSPSKSSPSHLKSPRQWISFHVPKCLTCPTASSLQPPCLTSFRS